MTDMCITRQHNGKAKIRKPAEHNALANEERKASRVATWLTDPGSQKPQRESGTGPWQGLVSGCETPQ